MIQPHGQSDTLSQYQKTRIYLETNTTKNQPLEEQRDGDDLCTVVDTKCRKIFSETDRWITIQLATPDEKPQSWRNLWTTNKYGGEEMQDVDGTHTFGAETTGSGKW